MKFSILKKVSTCTLFQDSHFTYFIQPPRPAPRSITGLPFPSTTCSPCIRRIPFDMLADVMRAAGLYLGMLFRSKEVVATLVLTLQRVD